jgi:hypothetical protein
MTDSDETVLNACLECDEFSENTIRDLRIRFGNDRLLRLHWYSKELAATLDAKDVAKLIRVLTLLDNAENGSYGMTGSTAGIHRLLAILADKDAELAKEMEIWAFHTARNPYIPYGCRDRENYRYLSVAEYHRQKTDRAIRHSVTEHEQQEAAKNRRIASKDLHATRMKHQHDDRLLRKQQIAELEAQTNPIERLSAIARNPEHAPYYFPETFAAFPPEAFARIDPAVRAILIERLQSAPKGQWRHLLDALTAIQC